MYCWGYGALGRLGDGSADSSKATPVRVSGLTGIRQLAAGADHACAVKADATVVCWGENDEGQLGGTTSGAFSSVPVPVDGLVNIVQLALGFSHSCALDGEGKVRCRGRDGEGQLGDGSAGGFRAAAAPVVELDDVVQVAAGLHSTCAVRRDGSIWCWGLNNLGQLGNPSQASQEPSPRCRRATSPTQPR